MRKGRAKGEKCSRRHPRRGARFPLVIALPTMLAMTTPDPAARVALMTAPNLEVAQRLARAFVAEKVAACVNLVPAVTSIYRWNDAIEESSEVLLIVKTSANRVAELEAATRALHPYECPELVVVDPCHVGADYLTWWLANTAR